MSPEGTELFKQLSAAQHAEIMALARRIHLSSGSTLFDLGATADSLFFIERGRMALTLPMQVESRENDVLIEERLPGQTLGWSALISPCRFTLKASAPVATELLVLPKTLLLDYFKREPQVGYTVALNIAQVIGQRLQVVQTMWLREVQHLVNAHASIHIDQVDPRTSWWYEAADDS